MLDLFSGKDELGKLRRRVERLQRRKRITQAIDAQRQLCDRLAEDRGEWERLADLARMGNRQSLELTARFQVAKLHRAGPKQWLDLVQLARDVGANEQAIAAQFRAADAYAMVGDSDQAIQLFDEILTTDPNHKMARRLRQLLVSKRALPPDEATETADMGFIEGQDAEKEETTLNYLHGHGSYRPPPELGLAYEEAAEGLDFDEHTSPGWTRSTPDFGTDENPTPARYVCVPQRWPTVLQRRPLLFVGGLSEIEIDLSGLVNRISLGPNSSVLMQGHNPELLYCLREGTVRVSRNRDKEYHLGKIEGGDFFGELGALMGLPSTTTAITESSTVVDVVSHERIGELIRENQGIPPLIRQLRSWYLDTVFQICLLSRHDSEAWRAEQEQMRWATFAKGDVLAEQGREGSLYVLLTGFARVTRTDRGVTRILGYICPGDICGEIDPAPVSVSAESAISALRINRHHLHQLPPPALSDFGDHIGNCRRIVEGTT